LHVAHLKIGEGVDDFVGAHLLGDHPDDHRDRDPQTRMQGTPSI
jgi:hypothetical protein